MGDFSLDTTPVDTPVSLDSTQTAGINDTAAQSRAAKATIGLGPTVNQDYDNIYSQISGGQEQGFRAGAASTIDQASQDNRQKTLATIAQQRGSELSLKEVQGILEHGQTNPDNVIEKTYAQTYINNLKQAATHLDDNILTDAQTEDPDAVERYFNTGSDVLSRREYAIKAAQDAQGDVDNDAYFHVPFPEALGGPVAIGSKTSPIHSALNWATLGVWGGVRDEWLARGQHLGIPTQLQANVLQDESKRLLRLPENEFKQQFDDRYQSLKEQDPSMAQQWAMAIAGQSTNEMITRDAMSAANIVGAAGAVSTIKGILGSIGKRSAATVGRPIPPSSGDLSMGPDGVMRPGGGPPPGGGGGGTALLESPAVQQARKAVEDVLAASPAVPTKINMAEAVGDTKEAAVQKAVVSLTNPDPSRDAIDTLFDLHRSNQDAIAKNAGNNSREEHTRILDAGSSFEKNTVDVIQNTNQIVRLPALAEEGFRSVADLASDHFRGKENTIVNVDMTHDPISNTEWHTYTIGDYTGRPFANSQQAINHADINGYGKPTLVGTDPDIVYLPKAAVLENKYAGSYENAKGEIHEPNDNTGYVTPTEQKAFQNSKQITGSRVSKGELHLITDHENGAFITAKKEPGFGLVPVEHTSMGPKFGDELVAHNDKTQTAPRSNFVSEEKNGQWSFYLDDAKGTRAEVMPQVDPEPTHLPFNLKTGKFGEPLAYGPHVVQKGLGFHLQWFMPLNEQDSWLRENHLIKTDRQKSSSSTGGLVNGSFLGYFRLPQDTLSAAENENRFKLVYGQNRYMSLIKGEMKYVEDLYHGRVRDGKGFVDAMGGNITGRNAEIWNDFKRALTVAQKYPDPDTGLPGYYFKTPAEIQHFWNTAFGRPPALSEQQAYLAVARMDYADWVFRNISVFKNKARLGVMDHTLYTYKDGVKVPSAPFEGRFLKKLPEGSIPAMIHEADGSVRYYNAMSTTDKKVFRTEFKQGQYKGVQLYNPDTYPIKVFDKDQNPVRVVYVISKNIDSSPMTYKQVGYRGGGHWDYNYDHYIKQPMIRKFNVGGKTHWVYEGDATFAPIKTHADGQVFVSKLNQIRKHLSNKEIAQAKAVHVGYSDMPWKDFVKNFYPSRNKTSGELTVPRFNMYEDFRVVPKGFTIAEYDKNLIKKYEKITGDFINAANGEQSLARNFQVEYTGARDSHDIFEPRNTGTITNPMYKFQPAELTDPLVTLVRSMKRIIESSMGDDYRYSAVEHWLQENMDMMKDRPEKVMGAPLHYFMNGDLNRRFRSSLLGGAAESNRYKIKKLLGMPTYMDSQIHMLKQALADMAYEGNKVAVPASWALSKISSPTNFVRGMAFHENLGFWNWAQLAAQNAAYINFAALAPMHAIPGTFASWMHLWSRINMAKPIVKQLGRMAETFGWKPGEFEEAMQAYDRSGFGRIGNTLAIHDPKQTFMASTVKDLVSKGTIFFDLAEQNVRHGAWYTAYHEWKRASPNTKLDDVEVGKIGARADDLYMNMGRNSKTLLNTGVTSMTLQFFKYIENVGHLFMSKRIGNVFGKENNWKTRAQQRAQMIAMYSLMFGPLGATGLSLLPINDEVRKYAISAGYVPGQNLASSLVLEGPVSVAGAYASGWWRTGHMDMSKGTFYNFNNRYGANGYQVLRDLLEPSPVLWKVLLGASGSTLANNLASLSPFVYAWKSAYADDSASPFKLTVSDWFDGLKNINSIRYGDRLVYALEFGKWLDRHGRPADDQSIGKVDAIFRTLLGVNDQRIDDSYLKSLISKEEKTDYSVAAQEYQHYRRLAEESAKNGDQEQAIAYNRNANFVLQRHGVPPEEASKIFAQDANLNKGSIQITNDSFYKKLVPTYRQPAADKAYQQSK